MVKVCVVGCVSGEIEVIKLNREQAKNDLGNY